MQFKLQTPHSTPSSLSALTPHPSPSPPPPLMESFWFIIFMVTLFTYFALKSFLNLIIGNRSNSNIRRKLKLPPGPVTIPILSSVQWLRKSFVDELEPILRNLLSKYGPIITLRIGHGNAIFIAAHDLAHEALIQNGAIFADRPPTLTTSKFISSNQHIISSATYGPLWRLLRRNLISEIFNPSRIKSYYPARKWVLKLLKHNLIKSQLESDSSEPEPAGVRVVDHFRFAVFSLLVLMCFGDKLDEKRIKQVEVVQRSLLLSFSRFNILNFFPSRLGRILFRNKWCQLHELKSNQEKVLLPLIRSRREKTHKYHLNDNDEDEKFVQVAYVDTLFNLELPEEEGGTSLKEEEIVSLCSEFLNAGTDTTYTALHWIMANLVNYPEIQSKVFAEIKGVVKPEDDEIKEEDLHKMPYLKAVILEGLRRHPPSHFVLPHAVAHDFNLNGYDIPKDATVNFMVAEMGWDPKVWEEPMEFKPERFLINGGDGKGEVFDITGTREIKMMPFGAGRRICPALGLAILHLEYFVANLVRDFEWIAVRGVGVDLSEKQEFTMVMKNPLKAHISLRVN